MPRSSGRETVVLRALANPARQQILDLLGREPATSAMLARALRSNTGVTSYHLRELGKAGLIEQDPQLSRGRLVYWRLSAQDVRFRDPAQSEQPQLAQATIDLTLGGLTASVHHYLHRTDLDPRWRDAALFSRSALRLTATELKRFQREYLALLSRFNALSTKTSRQRKPVRVALFAFPDHD